MWNMARALGRIVREFGAAVHTWHGVRHRVPRYGSVGAPRDAAAKRAGLDQRPDRPEPQTRAEAPGARAA
ncbi:MAG: hypothetical protein ACRDTQ_17395 [Micromonosporaceae bacterium]